ncbi:MAG TPA: hypothetical protein VN612_10480 [Acidobacteriaceae bacterium]|nr:hypothetical protein [Acidobacteriaceae bacterium]
MSADNVKRYALSTGFPREHKDGKYVLSKDYDAVVRDNECLRNTLLAAREWLSGWASAEPYIGMIDDALRAQGESRG